MAARDYRPGLSYANARMCLSEALFVLVWTQKKRRSALGPIARRRAIVETLMSDLGISILQLTSVAGHPRADPYFKASIRSFASSIRLPAPVYIVREPS
jgi:hypothetical protein